MKRLALSLLASLVLSLGLSSAHASMVDTVTTSVADKAPVYGVFHDEPTNFVFVKLPQGWVFAGSDESKGRHEVFLDEPTKFVFVKLSNGWKFVGTARG